MIEAECIRTSLEGIIFRTPNGTHLTDVSTNKAVDSTVAWVERARGYWTPATQDCATVMGTPPVGFCKDTTSKGDVPSVGV